MESFPNPPQGGNSLLFLNRFVFLLEGCRAEAASRPMFLFEIPNVEDFRHHQGDLETRAYRLADRVLL